MSMMLKLARGTKESGYEKISKTWNIRRRFIPSLGRNAAILYGVALAVALLFVSPPVLAGETQDILAATGSKGGLVVHLGCGDGKLTAALRANESFIVHGLDANAKNVAIARQNIQALGVYGKVTVEQWSNARLPYADNLVNLLVAENLGGIPMDEVMRVLAPNGVALIGGKKMVKPWPKEIDEWTHFLHGPDNNAVAHDTRVGPPKGLQWCAGPLYCRSHQTDSSISAMVSASGRIFYILDEGPTGVIEERFPQQWALVARDAFSGVFLWKVALPNWGWPEWLKSELTGKDWSVTGGGGRLHSPETLPRRLVCDGQRVYVTLGYNAPVSVLDAASGRLLRTITGTEYADEILCSKGLLLVCVRPERLTGEEESSGGRKGRKQVAGNVATPAPGANGNRLLAFNPATGALVWQVAAGEVPSLCLAADGEHVYYHNCSELFCRNLTNGVVQWRSASQAKLGGLFKGSNTLIAHDGVVLFDNGGDLMAFAARNGKLLWKTEAKKGLGHSMSTPPDLFVTGGLVWSCRNPSGLDPLSGQVRRTIDLKQLINPAHHFRCYRSKATDRFLIWPKQGAEFIDLEGSDSMRHDWFRGPCRYGILPCNGLVYSGPHQCACFAGVKLNGFNALTATSAASEVHFTETSRFEQGPAYESVVKLKPQSVNPGDWPTFRADSKRSGATASAAPTHVSPLWQTKLPGKLSQPVVAGGKLLVAVTDAAQVCCLDAQDGRSLWTFTAGGRVDSPPTIYGGVALFGSADGWVYCVRVADGALAWRFRAAPAERLLVAMDQVESVWPVHGTVLVQNGVAYVAAGRSTFLDGGIFLSALDPLSGKLLHEAHVEGPYPDVKTDNGGSKSMQGARSDVLVGDGKAVYLRQVKFDAALKLQGPWTTQLPGPESAGLRLTSTSDLLDDSGFDRACWHYSDWDSSHDGGNSGQLLVFNQTTTFAVQMYYKHSGYFPGKGDVKLFSMPNPATESNAPRTKRDKRQAQRNTENPWTATLPIYARALAMADKTLFVAGPPDALDPKDPLAALEGRKGGVLWAVSAINGRNLSVSTLEAPPVFDGLIAAGGRLFVSLTNGKVLCLGEHDSKP